MKKRKPSDNIKMIITGGHLTPALAVIEELQNSNLKDKITKINKCLMPVVFAQTDYKIYRY